MGKHFFENLDEASIACARDIITRAAQAVAERGRFIWALAGGSTPAQLYNLLSLPPLTLEIDWGKTFFLWGDERCLPPDHRHSNYRMVKEAMLKHLPIEAEQIIAMNGQMVPQEGALLYENNIRSLLESSPKNEARIDCILLGMGQDGHTASLFPGSKAIEEQKRWVVDVPPPEQAEPKVARLTMTLPLITEARSIFVLAGGSSKRAIIDQLSSGPNDQYPISNLADLASTTWYVY